MAIAKYVFPVPAGPIPKAISWFLMASIYSFCVGFFGVTGRFFEVTSPVGQFGQITPENINPNKLYIVCRYNQHIISTPQEREIFYKIFNELDGKKYDYGQLLSILLNEILDWSPIDYLPIFDFSRKRKVCSVMARACWISWWKKYAIPKGLGFSRPGGPLHVERTAPALFELAPDFGIVGILYFNSWYSLRIW